MSILDTTGISYRDAYDHVNRYVHTERAAIKKLQEALRDGDEVMARAIRAVAESAGWDVSLEATSHAQRAQDAIRALIDERNTKAATINAQRADGTITDRGEQQQIDIARTSGRWLEKLDAIRDTAQVYIDATKTDLQRALARFTEPTGSAQDQLLTEMRLTRAWGRIRQEIESPTAATTNYTIALNIRLSESTDPHEVAAILSEGPSYTRTYGEADPTAVFHDTLASKDTRVAAAVEAARIATQFETVLNHNLRQAREILTVHHSSPLGLDSTAYVDMVTIDYSK